MTAQGWTCVDCGAWCSSTVEHTCGEKLTGCGLCDDVFIDVVAWAHHADLLHGGAIQHQEIPMEDPKPEIPKLQPSLF